MISTRIADRYVLLAPLGSGGEGPASSARAMSRAGAKSRCGWRWGRSPRLCPPRRRPGTSAGSTSSIPAWIRSTGAYQVFELLEGKTLGEMIKDGAMDAGTWRPFVDQSLDAVEAVHLANWAHGDINADNFMLTGGGWKLIELPFFHFETPVQRSAIFGSIYTLAPEQIDGAKPSVRSDLYSLGCLYYYAAAGRWPQEGSTIQEIAISRLMRPAADLKGETARGAGALVRLGHAPARVKSDGSPAIHRGGTSTAGRSSCINAVC